MFCKNCGAELVGELSYCPNCGKKVGGKSLGRGGVVECIKKDKVLIIVTVMALVIICTVAAIVDGAKSKDAEVAEVTVDNDVQSSDSEAAEVAALTQKLIAVDDVWEMTRTDVYNLWKETYPDIKIDGDFIRFTLAKNENTETWGSFQFSDDNRLIFISVESSVPEKWCKESADQFKKTFEKEYGEPYYEVFDMGECWTWETYNAMIILAVPKYAEKNNKVYITVLVQEMQNE